MGEYITSTTTAENSESTAPQSHYNSTESNNDKRRSCLEIVKPNSLCRAPQCSLLSPSSNLTFESLRSCIIVSTGSSLSARFAASTTAARYEESSRSYCISSSAGLSSKLGHS